MRTTIEDLMFNSYVIKNNKIIIDIDKILLYIPLGNLEIKHYIEILKSLAENNKIKDMKKIINLLNKKIEETTLNN